MRSFILIAALVVLASASFAQKFTVRGRVTDTLSSPMPSATIMLMNPKDSTLVNFSVSDVQGSFEMKNIVKGDYDIKISFIGFAPFSKRINVGLSTATTFDVGTLQLQPESKQLDELVVLGEANPVAIKGDTIEFNAGSFKTKANANVEDLLKKMPGMEVENDGTIRAQGQQVQRVTVDGREFFGRDPKLATRNLPADAIDKVQVFDKKSDQAAFTGIDDGQKEKTINLELKEEKRNGAFGTLMAGGGTNDRFQGRASINKFGKGKQLSFLGMGNNINEQGFSIDDYMNFSGGMQGGFGGGGSVRIQFDANNANGVPLNFGGRQNGIMTNYAAGLNANRDLNGNKTKINGSYFYNRLDQNVIRSLNRINYLPDNQNYFFDQQSRQLSDNDNHRINATIDHSIDSANSIRFNTNLAYNETEQTMVSTSETTSSGNQIQNESERTSYNASTALSLNSNLLYRHKFGKKGRTFSTNLTLGVGQNDSDGTLNSFNLFYTGVQEKIDILQSNEQITDNFSYSANLSYTEPLGKRRYLEALYNYRSNLNEVDRKVLDEQNDVFSLNTQLSNKYNSIYTYHRPGFNLRMNRQKYNVAAGASYQLTDLNGEILFKEIDPAKENVNIDRSFNRLLPTARFNYDFTSSRNFRLDYETSLQEPTIQQLSPVVDNSDPLNIYEGNPALKPGYSHRVNASFTSFDPGRLISFFTFLTATYTTDAISNSQTISRQLVRLTSPVNVKDNLLVNGNVNFGFPVRKLFSRFNFGPTITQLETINILNGEENKTTAQTIGGTARYNFTFKEILTIDLSANWSRQETKYEFNSRLNQIYFNKTYTAESNLSFLKKYQLSGSFEYLVYNSETNNFNQTIPLLNLGVSRFILKNNAGELKVGVNNMLDRSLSVSQTATANYLQQERINNLGRFLMISFTYALNKQLNPFAGGGPRGGMRMMIRQ